MVFWLLVLQLVLVELHLYTDFHNDVYVFQATTATNTSTTLSIFENPYYFEFDPSASQISSVVTAAPIFQLSQSLSISGDILAVVEKNIGEDVNNDSINGVISATQVLASTAYTTKHYNVFRTSKSFSKFPSSIFRSRWLPYMESVCWNI